MIHGHSSRTTWQNRRLGSIQQRSHMSGLLTQKGRRWNFDTTVWLRFVLFLRLDRRSRSCSCCRLATRTGFLGFLFGFLAAGLVFECCAFRRSELGRSPDRQDS